MLRLKSHWRVDKDYIKTLFIDHIWDFQVGGVVEILLVLFKASVVVDLFNFKINLATILLKDFLFNLFQPESRQDKNHGS